MGVTTLEQRALLTAIRDLFGIGPFDTSSIASKTFDHPELVAVIEAALAGPRWRTRGRRGVSQQSRNSLRYLLTHLAKQHFTTDEYGWWYLKRHSHD